MITWTKKKIDFSKKLVNDVRTLLWVVTVSCIALAFYCVYLGYLGTLPWIAGMVSAAWASHGTICSFYLNMAKSDHSEGGITYEQAMKEYDNTDIQI